jgi:uncharacterized OB-fold protein
MAPVVQEGIREKRLFGSKCGRCGYISFPAMTLCPKCGPTYVKEVKPTELPSMGAAITWTKLQVAPKGFPSPLIHCVVDLSGVKIIGTVQGSLEIQGGENLAVVEDPSGRFPFVFSRLEVKPR